MEKVKMLKASASDRWRGHAEARPPPASAQFCVKELRGSVCIRSHWGRCTSDPGLLLCKGLPLSAYSSLVSVQFSPNHYGHISHR